MATINLSGGTATDGFNYQNWNVSLLMGIIASTFSSSHSSTQVVYPDPSGGTLTATGTFSGFNGDGDPTGGTITAITHITQFHSPQFPITVAITGLSISVPNLFNWIATNNVAAAETAVFGGNDTFNGGANNEAIYGYAGDDTIHGNNGNDTLLGGIGNDTLNGGDGNDTLDSSFADGNDTLNGGAGDDVIYSLGVDTIDGGVGVDLVHVTLAAATSMSTADLAAPGGLALANGTTIRNVEGVALTGSSFDDTLTIAGPGIAGSAFDGGAGNDTLVGDFSASSANLTLVGSPTPGQQQQFVGYSLANVERYVVSTGSGNDTLIGGSGANILDAGGGDDLVFSVGAGEHINGGAGFDHLVISRTAGNFSASLASFLTGITLADGSLISGFEAVDLTTGAGNDIFDMTGAHGTSSFFAGAGVDRLIFVDDPSADYLRLLNGELSFGVLGQIVNFVEMSGVEEFYITGGNGDDLLTLNSDGMLAHFDGGAGNDFLSGRDGNDVLNGGDGNDQLGGGAGANIMSGGAGDDRIATGSSSDQIDGGAGVDTAVIGFGAATSISLSLDGLFSTGTLGDGRIFSNVENYEISLTNGADTISVSNLQGTHTTIDAGFDAGDRLVVDFSATTGANGLGILDSSGRSFSLGSNSGANQLTANGVDSVIYQGGSGVDFVSGGPGDDQIFGNGGNDFLSSGAGSSIFSFDGGVNVLSGGAGDDTLDGGTRDTFDGGAGVDQVTILSRPASHAGFIYDNVAMATVVGQALPDGGLIRNAESINIAGGDGDDAMRFVNPTGSNGFNGGAGFDSLFVDLSTTTAPVSGGIAEISSSAFHLSYSAEQVTFQLGSGNDVIFGSFGADTYYGNGGNDDLEAHEGDDVLFGGAGNDTLIGGSGTDYMAGGTGDDLYWVTESTDNAVESAGEGYDVIQAFLPYAMTLNVEEMRLMGVVQFGVGNVQNNIIFGNAAANELQGLDGNDTLHGDAGIDLLYGQNGDDVIFGEADNDALIGDAGNDTLDGGAAQDYMAGGVGDDTYFVDNIGDNPIENSGEGNDTIFASTSYAMTLNVETMHLTGTAPYGVGNSQDNIIFGNDSFNELQGLDGNDTLYGGGGGAFDLLYGQNGNDTLFGQDGDDALIGDAGNDSLDGGTGADYLLGGSGDDTYFVDDFRDYPIESPGGGNDTIMASVSYTITANVETMQLVGSAQNGNGNDDANTIIGNGLVNEIRGLGGDDHIIGGGNTDFLYGGAGADTFVYQAASDAAPATLDAIMDFQVGVDHIDLSAVHTSVSDTFFFTQSGGNTFLHVDLGGNGSDDLLINIFQVTGVTNADVIWGGG